MVAQVPQHEAWVANQLARALAYGGDTEVRRTRVEHNARQARIAEVFAFVSGEQLPNPGRVKKILGRRMNRQKTRGQGGRVSDWSEEQVAGILRLAGPVMEQLGYERP